MRNAVNNFRMYQWVRTANDILESIQYAPMPQYVTPIVCCNALLAKKSQRMEKCICTFVNRYLVPTYILNLDNTMLILNVFNVFFLDLV